MPITPFVYVKRGNSMTYTQVGVATLSPGYLIEVDAIAIMD